MLNPETLHPSRADFFTHVFFEFQTNEANAASNCLIVVAGQGLETVIFKSFPPTSSPAHPFQ
jgi:hypothetical protein